MPTYPWLPPHLRNSFHPPTSVVPGHPGSSLILWLVLCLLTSCFLLLFLPLPTVGFPRVLVLHSAHNASTRWHLVILFGWLTRTYIWHLNPLCALKACGERCMAPSNEPGDYKPPISPCGYLIIASLCNLYTMQPLKRKRQLHMDWFGMISTINYMEKNNKT